MGGSNSLEVVRNMKNLCSFTAICSLLLGIGVALSNTAEALGYPLAAFFICISLYLSGYSMKQRGLWEANETRLLEEYQSSASSSIKEES